MKTYQSNIRASSEHFFNLIYSHQIIPKFHFESNSPLPLRHSLNNFINKGTKLVDDADLHSDSKESGRVYYFPIKVTNLWEKNAVRFNWFSGYDYGGSIDSNWLYRKINCICREMENTVWFLGTRRLISEICKQNRLKISLWKHEKDYQDLVGGGKKNANLNKIHL